MESSIVIQMVQTLHATCTISILSADIQLVKSAKNLSTEITLLSRKVLSGSIIR